MEYVRKGKRIVLRLDKGDNISESIITVAEKEKIVAGSVVGIGATDDFTVGVFNTEKGTYDEFLYTGTHEITSLTGNITFVIGKPYVHLHITAAGKEGKVVGGHLIKGVISLTAEIFIDIFPKTVKRKRDENLKINLLEF